MMFSFNFKKDSTDFMCFEFRGVEKKQNNFNPSLEN